MVDRLLKISLRPGGPQIAGFALDHAHRLARPCAAKLLLLRIVPTEFLFVPLGSVHTKPVPQQSNTPKRNCKNWPQTRVNDVVHQEILGEGQVWPALHDIIQSDQIDLVATGTHGHISNRNLALGSIAEEIFPCPGQTLRRY
jgi:nucleotide-binding universal stress UspA family protein